MDVIDLGRKYDEPCCSQVEKGADEDRIVYPTLFIDGKSDELKDLPESGLLTVKFKLTSKTVSERDGKKTCSVALDVKKIVNVEAAEKPKRSREDELDELYAEESKD